MPEIVTRKEIIKYAKKDINWKENRNKVANQLWMRILWPMQIKEKRLIYWFKKKLGEEKWKLIISNLKNNLNDANANKMLWSCFDHINSDSSAKDLTTAIMTFLWDNVWIKYDFNAHLSMMCRQWSAQYKNRIVSNPNAWQQENLDKAKEIWLKLFNSNYEKLKDCWVVSDYFQKSEEILTFLENNPEQLVHYDWILKKTYNQPALNLTDFLENRKVWVCADFSDVWEKLFNYLTKKHNIMAHMETIIDTKNEHAYNVIYELDNSKSYIKKTYCDFTNQNSYYGDDYEDEYKIIVDADNNVAINKVV